MVFSGKLLNIPTVEGKSLNFQKDEKWFSVHIDTQQVHRNQISALVSATQHAEFDAET